MLFIVLHLAGRAEQLLQPFKDSLQKAPKNWFHLDKTRDGFMGVSTEKTYTELLKGKPTKTVVVAIIDSGVDIDHEDLKANIWTNPKEIPNNGIDDDNNGYIDDIHGWNFIGGKDGKSVHYDTYELTRIYKKLKQRFEGKSASNISPTEKADYEYFLDIQAKFNEKQTEMRSGMEQFGIFNEIYTKSVRLLKAYLDTEELTNEMVQGIESQDERIMAAKSVYLQAAVFGLDEASLAEAEAYYRNGLQYGYNPDFDPRHIVGDNYEDSSERYYGNNDVKGPDAEHGTHVAGIVAAVRNNGIGIDGIASDVRIMAIRAVPEGDERDKDVANAIRYAVDNGAQIINMSFGKQYTTDKAAVDAAIQYAESRGVLLIHAAGNEAMDTDKVNFYPQRQYNNGKKANNWLDVGALSWKNGEEAVANFSNYGKNTVDFFAPGVDIFSTVPNQKYKEQSGTSMAAPVATGVAALVLSYFPHLTAVQLRDILLKSVIKTDQSVKVPGSENTAKFSTLCITGGIVNAYRAVQEAMKVKVPTKK
ncbi:MAG: S8 family peptidase [Cytophagales bacterium]|nr:S8 family peptidase [Bernardetiaceae bacterium]MDW8204255.1 S8 family peptidase [Cytophagales bacterium]